MQMIPTCHPRNNVKALAAGPFPDPVVGAGRRGAGKCATSLGWGGVVGVGYEVSVDLRGQLGRGLHPVQETDDLRGQLREGPP